MLPFLLPEPSQLFAKRAGKMNNSFATSRRLRQGKPIIFQRILCQILTPKDLWELNQQLGR
jgi:hypothetical protein